MRICDIYFIKPEVARHYFGQEVKIFNLFQELKTSSNFMKPIIEKQVKYITKPIPAMKIQRLVSQSLQNVPNYQVDNFKHYLELDNGKSKAQLTISLGQITILSEGTTEAETVFFEVIRQFAANFIAIDLDSERFGWLNPIKEVKFI